MRTLLFSAVFFFNTVLALTQITIEHSYPYSAGVSEVGNEEYMYFLMDVPQKQCRIYNTYHVLQKTINLTVPEGYYLSDIKFVSKNIFNTDDLIELLYIYEKYVSTETWYYYQYGMGVVNENGTQLLSLPGGAFAEVKHVGNENKLLAYTYTYNLLGLYYDVVTNVYSLGGTSDFIGSIGFENQIVFPNPTKDQILINTSSVPENFKGDFNLYTVDGLRVLSIPVRKGEMQSIPVGQLGSGAYIYSISDQNQLIHSNKIIIR